MRIPLRLLTLAGAVALTLVGADAAVAGKPASGFYVFKDLRNSGVVEYRDAATGRLIARNMAHGDEAAPGTACGDSHHTMIGARWKAFEPFRVNTSSVPGYLADGAALDDLRAAHSAWSNPFSTDCGTVPGASEYEVVFGGTTSAAASLSTLAFDGENAVAFGRLENTVCAGPGVVACVVAFSRAGGFVEADMLIESDLGDQLGGDYVWTTGDTTHADGEGGELAVIDVATHEFGHWAGLGHVKSSPGLTMFPAVRDGMQTLGLGDMKGLLARY